MNRLTRPGDAGRKSTTQQTLQESLHPDDARGNTSASSFFLPARYEENYRYPLVVWLHQDGGSHRQLVEVMPHISTQNFIGVGIQGTRAMDTAGHRYQWLQSSLGTAVAEEAIFSAIEAAERRYSINPDRIYLAGYREGGTMGVRVGLRNSHKFDGVISIDSPLPRGGRPLGNLAAARELAILSAVAIEGQQYPMQRVCEDLRLWHAASLRMDMRQYTVDDCMVAEVLRDINTWIMARVTDQPEMARAMDYETVPVSFSNN